MGGHVRAPQPAGPVASALARRLLVLLAVVFVLSAADPTPRFLGFYRRAHGEALRVPTRRMNPVLPDFSQPVAISWGAGTTSPEEIAATPAMTQPAQGPEVVMGVARSTAPSRTLSLDPLRRNGAGPPLRC